MNCFKCSCGCDRLTKEELEHILQSTNSYREFLNNETARNMFRSMIYPDETNTPQPSGSQNRPVGKRPKPMAIKYLELIEEADRLRQANDLSEEDVEKFADSVPDLELGDRLCESTSTNREEVLKDIIRKYGPNLTVTDEYKKFITKLTKAHDGKIKLEKS
ncbi:uncharacterized protein LOC126560097 [Anopheles maculipalpis]|uniref:uncharacterized protein LOC126560097 n=1 Tax=Anopheles maculipalpis TaxID=1496333 RepID=UPI002159251F|nr:uncharacterized protein LOC126560097 [Anopheles maculipalpis]